MAVSKAQIKAVTKYEKENYFKVLTRFPKAQEETIRAAAGDSLNGFIVRAVMEKIERDGLRHAREDDPEEIPPAL